MASRLGVFFLVCLGPSHVLAQDRVVLKWGLLSGGLDFAWFGRSVDLSGDTAVVGEPKGHEDTAGRRSGAAYVYQPFDPFWTEGIELVPSERALNDSFGSEVAISGDTAVVGGGTKLFIFGRNRGGTNQWGEVKKLTFATAVDSFDIDGDTLILGGANVAVVFEKNSGGPANWGPSAILSPPGASGFGGSLSLSGDVAAIASGEGVWLLERDRLAPNGWGLLKTLPFPGFVRLDADTLVVSSYGVHVFDRDAGGLDHWGRVAVLSEVGPVPPSGSSFGDAIAVSRNVIVVGAPLADFEDLGGIQPGAAFVYLRDEGGMNQWGLAEKVIGDAGFRANYGSAVTAWNDRIIVGAFLEDAPWEDTGAAFVYSVDSAPIATCAALPSYSASALTLDFTLATPTPVRWDLWLSISSTSTRVWSVSLPPVASAVSFKLPIAGFPHLGKIGVLSTFASSTKGLICSDWRIVDTDAP